MGATRNERRARGTRGLSLRLGDGKGEGREAIDRPVGRSKVCPISRGGRREESDLPGLAVQPGLSPPTQRSPFFPSRPIVVGSGDRTVSAERGFSENLRGSVSSRLLAESTEPPTTPLGVIAWGQRSGRQALGRTPRALFAFKISTIHVVLQFTRRIALCCVRHRRGNQGIHC